MTPSDRYEPRLMDRDIITRSDYVPTDYERYGNWARKFFGYGHHQAYKDSAATLARTTPTPTQH